jgi:hypothetical protein
MARIFPSALDLGCASTSVRKAGKETSTIKSIFKQASARARMQSRAVGAVFAVCRRDPRALELLDQIGLSARADRHPEDRRDGEKQRAPAKSCCSLKSEKFHRSRYSI